MRLLQGSKPIEESALVGPTAAMAATKMALGLNASRDGLAITPQNYETVAFIWAQNYEKYIMSLSAAGLSSRSGEPTTLEYAYLGNAAAKGRAQAAAHLKECYMTFVHECEVLLRHNTCILKD